MCSFSICTLLANYHYQIRSCCFDLDLKEIEIMYTKLFSSYCGSLYTCHLWCNYTVQQYRQMHVAYNNVFRRLMGYHKFCSASGMFEENRIDNFDARIRRLVYGFYQRLMCSGNSLVNCVMNTAWLSSDLYRNWNKCLYVSEMVFMFFCTFFSAVIYFVSSKAATCLEVFFFLFCYKLLSFLFCYYVYTL